LTISWLVQHHAPHAKKNDTTATDKKIVEAQEN